VGEVEKWMVKKGREKGKRWKRWGRGGHPSFEREKWISRDLEIWDREVDIHPFTSLFLRSGERGEETRMRSSILSDFLRSWRGHGSAMVTFTFRWKREIGFSQKCGHRVKPIGNNRKSQHTQIMGRIRKCLRSSEGLADGVVCHPPTLCG